MEKQTPREILAKLAAMTPAEFDRFMLHHFLAQRRKPLPDKACADDDSRAV